MKQYLSVFYFCFLRNFALVFYLYFSRKMLKFVWLSILRMTGRSHIKKEVIIPSLRGVGNFLVNNYLTYNFDASSSAAVRHNCIVQ